MPILQEKINFVVPAAAKYEHDGNLYIIDNGSFRLFCMTPEGRIRYAITIDKMKEYTKFYDCAIDEMGNLYVYAMEMGYGAYLTKRDMIKKYDKRGRFVKDVLVVDYDENSEDRPHGFAQFGGLRYEEDVLTFSRMRKDGAELYTYDVIRDRLCSTRLISGDNYTIAQLVLKNFDNFIFSTRDGNIYEIKNGGPPILRASFDFSESEGGGIPWYLNYDADGILFFEMTSGLIRHIGGDALDTPLPQAFFEDLRSGGEVPLLTRFGSFNGRFAGVFGETVWYYDGSFTTYENGITLSLPDRLKIAVVHICFVLGIISLGAGLYLLFVHIFGRYISLFIKQTVVVIPLVVAAFAVLYTVTFNIMNKRLNDEIFNELSLAAFTSSKLLNGDDIEKLKSIKDVNSDAYKRISQTLKDIVGNNANKWNKSYYAGLYQGSHFQYWTAISSDEINLLRPSSPFEEGTDEWNLFMSGEPLTGIGETVDGFWGYSAVAVRNSEGKAVAMFEMGMDMASYQVGNAMQQRRISLIAAVICLVILLALIAIMSNIVRQLAAFARVLADISHGNYGVRVSYHARDELGKVSNGLNSMAVELQKQIEYINRLNESSVRFVPIQFMEQLNVPDITDLKLGDNVEHHLTVLFFDIRSFSIHSEMMSAKENFMFINEVLGVAGPILRQHNGFVDKYLGDSAMALFTDALDATRAGIEIYQKLILDAETRVTVGGDAINIGIGLHTGRVMMGIVGEKQRLSSTVVSKNVNLASRMESLTKQTKSGMLITRETLSQVGDSEKEFSYRFIGMVQVAGFNEVIGVFDMLDALPAATRQKRLATKKVFESGIRKYHTKDYPAAYKRFEAVVNADPGDACAQNCLEETCRRLADPSLPSVFVFDKK